MNNDSSYTKWCQRKTNIINNVSNTSIAFNIITYAVTPVLSIVLGLKILSCQAKHSDKGVLIDWNLFVGTKFCCTQN